MTTLHQYAHQNPHWTLEEFVTVLNRLLPQFLPDRPDSSDSSASIPSKSPHGVRDTLTPRLVRHYTSQGLVDEPQKLGRSARYGYRHLLQLLLVRRLLREGYSTQAHQPQAFGIVTPALPMTAPMPQSPRRLMFTPTSPTAVSVRAATLT